MVSELWVMGEELVAGDLVEGGFEEVLQCRVGSIERIGDGLLMDFYLIVF